MDSGTTTWCGYSRGGDSWEAWDHGWQPLHATAPVKSLSKGGHTQLALSDAVLVLTQSRLSRSLQLAGMVRTVAAAHGAATAVVVPAGKHGITVENHWSAHASARVEASEHKVDPH